MTNRADRFTPALADRDRVLSEIKTTTKLKHPRI